ncbi:MAG TPA: autotransporter outer membrane beta-barrel domain-containing protein [Ramlibacter sp.]|nr:autotransporter outer membrane beta-barrel domain-containing protein [Ramlibacter sp.]
MNTSYRSIYSLALGAWVAVSEHARARGKAVGASASLLLALGWAPAGAQSVLYWDGNGATPGAGSAPSGIWSTGSNAWSDAPAGDSASIDPWIDGSSAVFAAGGDASASYTVSLGGNVTAVGLRYQSGASGSVLTLAPGGTLNLAGAVMPEINVAVGSTLLVQAPVAGTAGLRKTGDGTLALTSVNSYSDGTSVEGGVLEISADNQLGSPSGELGLANGGTLRLAASNIGSARNITLAGSGGVIDVNDTRNGTFAGTISGSGALALVNTGAPVPTADLRITLSGANTYDGGTRVGIQGVDGARVNARATGSSSLGTGPVDIYLNSEMMFSGSGASAGGLMITTHESSNLLGTNSGTYFVNGASAGSAHLVNQGRGSYVIIEGANTSAATSQIDNNGGRVGFFGASSGGSATINNNAGGMVMVFDDANLSGTSIRNNDGTVFVSTAGAGIAIGSLSGAGNVVLGDSDNQLTLGALGLNDIISGSLSDKGSGYLDALGRPYVQPATGSGGSLVKEGAGTLTLAGNNSYTGSTTVNGGTLLIEGNQSMASGAIAVNAGGTLTSSASGLTASAIDVRSGGTLAGNGTMSGAVNIANGGRLAPGNSAGTLSVGTLTLNSGSQLDYELGQPGTPGGSSNDLVNVAGNLTLAGTLNIAPPAGGSFGPGLYRLMNYGGTLTNNGLGFGSVPGSPADLYLQTSVAQQVNLVNRAGLTLHFWDGSGAVNNNSVDGGSGVMRIGGADERWTDAGGTFNAPWSPNGFAVFQGTPGTVMVSNVDGAVTFGGAQFAVGGYTLAGDTLTTDNANTIIRVGDSTAAGAGFTATVSAAIAGSGELVKEELGTLVLAGANSHSGGTRLNNGTLMANHDQALGTGTLSIQGGTLGSQSNAQLANNIVVAGDFALAPSGSAAPSLGLSGDMDLASAARITQVTDGTVDFSGAIGGAHGLTLDATASSSHYRFSGSKPNGYAGATTVQGNAVLELARTGGALAIPGNLTVAGQGVVRLQESEQIADTAMLTLSSTGLGAADALQFGAAGLSETIGTLMGSGNVGLAGSKLVVGAGDFSGRIRDNGAAGGGLEKVGTGTLRLSGSSSYSGPTSVSAGTLQAGAAQAFSASSAHSVAPGATLDTGGFSQTVASLANSGTVSLLASAAGSELTVRGAYVGNNGTLALGALLNASGPSDRLVLDGPGASASGRTHVQITNLGGLGAQTTGAGIEVIAARNGASTTAQGSRDAFALAGGHVDAGAFEYLLLPADQNGAGESWYLRSHSTVVAPPDPPKPAVLGQAPVPQQEQPRYRAEVPLFAALPAQLRQSDATMLGNLHRRIGDDDSRMPGAGTGERRAWGRLIGADLDIRQEGTVSPASSGHQEGFQAGTDLIALPAAAWRAGIYVGQMDADARVSGLARDGWGEVGTSDLRSQYFGAYATYAAPSGFYADAVLQYGRHKYGLHPGGNAPVSGKGDGLQASIELGQSVGLGGGWIIEPQFQLVHQQLDLDEVALGGTQVGNDADNGWLARIGVRIKGELSTGIGSLQPYARLNLYRASSGQDQVRFATPAASTTISSATGYSSAEVAGGFTLSLSPGVSVYGELGRLFDIGGDAQVKSSVEGSVGLRVRW